VSLKRRHASNPIPFVLAILSVAVTPQRRHGHRDLAAQRWPPGGSGGRSGSLAGSGYAETVRREFNQLEPENQLKFSNLRPTDSGWNFGPADTLVSFAAHNGMRVRGHVFVWHNQVPRWVSTGATPARLAEILRDHILTLGRRYRNKVFAWDVVNEAFNHDSNEGTLRTTLWHNAPGIGLAGTAYIEQAFRWAREADPNALLFYNDYGAEALNRSDAIYNMAQDFRARRCPSMASASMPLRHRFQSIRLHGVNIRRITDLGLRCTSPSWTFALR
jgi:endo-1,4-beta-xylanase